MKKSMQNYPAAMRDERIYQKDCLRYNKLDMYINFSKCSSHASNYLLYVIVNLFSIFCSVLQIAFAFSCNVFFLFFSYTLNLDKSCL